MQWQGKYLLALGQEQPTGAFGGNEPVYVLSTTEVDFSTQYQFTRWLQGYFEALNLTDQEYRTVGRFDNQMLNTDRLWTVVYRRGAPEVLTWCKPSRRSSSSAEEPPGGSPPASSPPAIRPG